MPLCCRPCEWFTPLGQVMQFSLASPLNADEETERFFGDETEQFQFSFRQPF